MEKNGNSLLEKERHTQNKSLIPLYIKVFEILAQKYPNKTFLVPNLGISVFSQNFAIRQIRGR